MASKNRKQLPYFERIPIEERPPFVFQERDLEVLKVVMTYRVVDSEIISALISGGNWGITQRLTKLYHWEFLSRPKDQIVLRIQQKHRHLIYTLDSEGVRCLVNELGLPRDKIRSHLKEPHHQFLEHSLMVSRLHACFELAIEHRDDLEFINLAAAEDGEHSVFWRQDTGLNTRVRIET
ncbi:MAG: replication-relaxation family protein, partial [Candidatus Zixiibacteriota bacterium]